ncbi:DMT family transporter [Pandoraea commovens]|uniref:DMT family transporter n=1 Tax=Pandoraea commovens TaxID=2508289 RepID=A0A5E4U1S7_9BURK|nr:DMT family transporter [Pandoraea commovens]UVA79742.1 DMT family transporter [Pandoraea commovens]VVD94065.1 multidrug DMT transporter [Pandoraea commovens]
MSLTALALVVTAAFLHATWNFVAKRIDTREGGGPQLVFLYALLTVVIYTPLALYFLAGQASWPSALGWGVITVSALLHYGYTLVLQRGYRVGDLSVVYPLARGTGPLLSSIGAIVLLGERPGWLALVGIALVVCGVLVIAGGERLFRRGSMHAGAGWGVLTGGFIAAYTLADAYAIRTLMLAPLVYYYLENVLRVVLSAPTALSRPTRIAVLWQANWRKILIISTISPMSYFLILTALKYAPVSHVAPAREMSMMVAALLGVRVLGEGEMHRRVGGAVLIALGVVGLTLG